MSTEYALDHGRRIVTSRASGRVTEQDLMQHVLAMRRLFEDGTVDATWSQLVDFRALTQLDAISSDAVRRLAAENPWPRAARRVFVAPAAVAFGLSRMYQLWTGTTNEHFHVVRSETEALSILSPTEGAP
jgi:hypothetical protein